MHGVGQSGGGRPAGVKRWLQSCEIPLVGRQPVRGRGGGAECASRPAPPRCMACAEALLGADALHVPRPAPAVASADGIGPPRRERRATPAPSPSASSRLAADLVTRISVATALARPLKVQQAWTARPTTTALSAAGGPDCACGWTHLHTAGVGHRHKCGSRMQAGLVHHHRPRRGRAARHGRAAAAGRGTVSSTRRRAGLTSARGLPRDGPRAGPQLHHRAGHLVPSTRACGADLAGGRSWCRTGPPAPPGPGRTRPPRRGFAHRQRVPGAHRLRDAMSLGRPLAMPIAPRSCPCVRPPGPRSLALAG